MSLIRNTRASRDYFLEDRYEAGLSLQGWEVKALAAGRAQLVEARVMFRKGEAYLLNCNITPLPNTAALSSPEPRRSRKLLLRKTELRKLAGKVMRAGYTIVPLAVRLKNHRLKLDIALAKGKKKYDQRRSVKERELKREQRRFFARRKAGKPLSN